MPPPPPNTAALLERIKRLEERRDDSHRDLDTVMQRLQDMSTTQLLSAERLKTLDANPIDVEKIRFSPRIVAAIAATCIAIVGGNYVTNSGLRESVARLDATIGNVQAAMLHQKDLAALEQKRADDRALATDKAIDEISKMQKLQALEIQSLKEMVLKQGVR